MMTTKDKTTTSVNLSGRTSFVSPNLEQNFLLTILLAMVPASLCDKLLREIERSDQFRQYAVCGAHAKPQLHLFTHPDAQDNQLTTPGPWYSYQGVTLRRITAKSIPTLNKVVSLVSKNVKVDKFNLGYDVVVYANNYDSIGWHCDNSQGKNTIACVILKSLGSSLLTNCF